jgi:hypothetical protein
VIEADYMLEYVYGVFLKEKRHQELDKVDGMVLKKT